MLLAVDDLCTESVSHLAGCTHIPFPRWYEKVAAESSVVDALCKDLRIGKTLAQLLSHKGFTNAEQADYFLHPKLARLEDPFKIAHLEAAARRVIAAVLGQQDVVILGDYDVDGITSTAMLVSALEALGLGNARYILPRRLEEGYGMSLAIIERAIKDKKPDLLISLDCGTTAVAEVAWLRERGVDVLIVDHHRSKHALPDCILVNPHVHDSEEAPWLHLCTVGLVFKLVHGLFKLLRAQSFAPASGIDIKDYLDFVALGTVADLVPLREENRILTQRGLHAISASRRPGIRALCETSGLEEGQAVHPADIAFKLGPRLNASGRLGDASCALEMLLSSNWSAAQRTADLLTHLNRERQIIERKVSHEAEQMAFEDPHARSGFVLYNPQWHSGVVGIVAGKLARRMHRPCIVLGSEGGLAKGSGRSITGLSLVALLEQCKDLLHSWGGHPMAVGISLDPDALPEFIARFNTVVSAQLTESLAHPRLELAAWLELSDVTEDFLMELELLRPFGEGNPEPIFGLRQVVLPHPPVLFGERHYRFQIPLPAGVLMGVAWGQSEHCIPVGVAVDMAVKLHWNHWNGRRLMQLELIDWRRN